MDKEVTVYGNPRVYKALKREFEKVLSELERISKVDEVSSDLLEVIALIDMTMNGLKEDDEPVLQ